MCPLTHPAPLTKGIFLKGPFQHPAPQSYCSGPSGDMSSLSTLNTIKSGQQARSEQNLEGGGSRERGQHGWAERAQDFLGIRISMCDINSAIQLNL